VWKPPEGQEGSQVLGSANQLFLKIRASLNRCVKLVSRGNTLLQLSGAFKVKVLTGLERWSCLTRLAATPRCVSGQSTQMLSTFAACTAHGTHVRVLLVLV